MTIRAWAGAIAVTALALAGCGGPTARVTGRVMCEGKPVPGIILFSPKGGNDSDRGPAVSADLKDDGSYEVRLKSAGTYTVVVTPRDVKYPVRPGESDFPCVRSPTEWDVVAGDNSIAIEMPKVK